MDKTHPLAQHMIVQFIATAFLMSNTCLFDHEIMQLPDSGGMSCVPSNVTMYLGDHKYALQVSPKVFVELAQIEITICHSSIGEVSLGPLGNTASQEACKQSDEGVSYDMMHYGTSKETCR